MTAARDMDHIAFCGDLSGGHTRGSGRVGGECWIYQRARTGAIGDRILSADRQCESDGTTRRLNHSSFQAKIAPDREMKYFILTLAFVALGNSSAAVQSGGSHEGAAVAPANAETKYRVAHQAGDSRFITSIERTGPCKLRGPPLTKAIRVPSELYPRESVDKHEEGTATIQLVFDADWCVRMATITESSGFWRLDNVTLWFAMTIKFTPKNILLTSDGEPTITLPIAWGASQGRK